MNLLEELIKQQFNKAEDKIEYLEDIKKEVLKFKD